MSNLVTYLNEIWELQHFNNRLKCMFFYFFFIFLLVYEHLDYFYSTFRGFSLSFLELDRPWAPFTFIVCLIDIFEYFVWTIPYLFILGEFRLIGSGTLFAIEMTRWWEKCLNQPEFTLFTFKTSTESKSLGFVSVCDVANAVFVLMWCCGRCESFYHGGTRLS